MYRTCAVIFEIWGDMGRHGEIWGDMGRRLPHLELRSALAAGLARRVGVVRQAAPVQTWGCDSPPFWSAPGAASERGQHLMKGPFTASPPLLRGASSSSGQAAPIGSPHQVSTTSSSSAPASSGRAPLLARLRGGVRREPLHVLETDLIVNNWGKVEVWTTSRST